MKVTEVETFILKFKQLWKAGLDLDTQAGETWVGIRVRQVPGPQPPKAEEATTDKVVNDAMEKDAETAEISEESSNCKNENVKLMERLLLLVFNVELNISSRIM